MVKKILFLLFTLFVLFSHQIYAEEQDELKKQIDEYSQKLVELGKAKDTLNNQIKIFDIQIAQTQLKIKQTSNSIDILKKDIADLSVKIGDLDISLNQLSAIYIQEIAQNYKLPKRIPLLSLISSGSFNNFFENYKYLSIIQKNSQENLLNLETTRTNLDLQKQAKAEKQKELEAMEKQLKSEQNNLANQKSSKTKLLQTTKNDEAKYQALLRQAMIEYEAIQNILIGNGVEVAAGEVKAGDKIASVIQGASCNSSGSHLHFMVKVNNSAINPFTRLKAGVEFTDNSGGDPFNPSGSWNWPLKGKINFTQGYGYTWAVKNTWVSKIYSFHTGIDIFSLSSPEVLATHEGTLYRGKFGGSCVLKYVRVQDKSDTSLSTYYLHVNYY